MPGEQGLMRGERFGRSMRFAPECVPCLLNRVIYETELVDPRKATETVDASLRMIAGADWRNTNSARLASKVHRRVYELVASSDPYRDLKLRSDSEAEKLFAKAKKFVEESNDRLEAAVLCAIAGNVLDFGIDVGIESPEQLGRKLELIVAEGLAVNDLPLAKKVLSHSSKVVYLLDNCGESVFDRLLVKEIGRLGPKVVGVAKGQPILTDVTLDDAKRVHLDSCFDEMLTTEQFAVGVDLASTSSRLRDEIDKADLVISKGMANFESLSDEPIRPILYLMRAKCGPVARAIGAKRNDNVARLVS